MRMVCLYIQWHMDGLFLIIKMAVLVLYLVQSWGPLELTSHLLSAQNLCVALLVVLIQNLWVTLELGKLRGPGHKRGHTHCTHVPSHSFIHSVNLLNLYLMSCIIQVLELCWIPALRVLMLRHANMWEQSNGIGERCRDKFNLII